MASCARASSRPGAASAASGGAGSGGGRFDEAVQRREGFRRASRALEIAKEKVASARGLLGDLLRLVETALAARPIADYESPPTRRYSSAFHSAGESGA